MSQIFLNRDLATKCSNDCCGLSCDWTLNCIGIKFCVSFDNHLSYKPLSGIYSDFVEIKYCVAQREEGMASSLQEKWKVECPKIIENSAKKWIRDAYCTSRLFSQDSLNRKSNP